MRYLLNMQDNYELLCKIRKSKLYMDKTGKKQ